jgi:hypothetical protein
MGFLFGWVAGGLSAGEGRGQLFFGVKVKESRFYGQIGDTAWF